ncbi:TM2 domain-containing protein [Pirellulaceae bacterium]|nr:TM2 domain-containing protein [Pirellulaceae bacterium]
MSCYLYGIGLPGVPELILLLLAGIVPVIVAVIVLAIVLRNEPSSSRNSKAAYHATNRPNVTQTSSADVGSKKLAAGLCGILIPALGIHKFILGYTNAGLIMLLVSLFTCGFGIIIFGTIGFIEGIIYLTKTEEEFYQVYILSRKEWF